MKGLVVVARQGSARMPMKHLYPLSDRMTVMDVLDHRMRQVKVDRYILAVGPGDRLYEEVGRAMGWVVLRDGFIEEGDVLGRVVKATYGLDRVALINGDSPLMCPGLVERMLWHRAPIVLSLGPSGLRAKVIDVGVLGKWAKWVKAQREHVLHGLVEPFPIVPMVVNQGVNCGKPLTIDTFDDLVFLRKVVADCGIDAKQTELIQTANALCDRANNWEGGATPDA